MKKYGNGGTHLIDYTGDILGIVLWSHTCLFLVLYVLPSTYGSQKSVYILVLLVKTCARFFLKKKEKMIQNAKTHCELCQILLEVFYPQMRILTKASYQNIKQTEHN